MAAEGPGDAAESVSWQALLHAPLCGHTPTHLQTRGLGRVERMLTIRKTVVQVRDGGRSRGVLVHGAHSRHLHARQRAR